MSTNRRELSKIMSQMKESQKLRQDFETKIHELKREAEKEKWVTEKLKTEIEEAKESFEKREEELKINLKKQEIEFQVRL